MVSAGSPTGYTTIKLADSGTTYASKNYRLRHVPAPLPPPAPAMAPPPAPSPAVVTVPDDQLSPEASREPCAFLDLFKTITSAPRDERERALNKLVGAFRPDGGVERLQEVNHGAFDGVSLNGPFLSAVKDACNKEKKLWGVANQQARWLRKVVIGRARLLSSRDPLADRT